MGKQWKKYLGNLTDRKEDTLTFINTLFNSIATKQKAWYVQDPE